MNHDNTVSTLLLHNNPDYALLKVAISFAEQGHSVWVISIAPIEKIPESIQQPCKEVLQLITFIYLKDYLDLVKHLTGIHKWKHIPNFIILRNFDTYCSLNDVEYNPVKSAFLSTTLLDSVAFLARKKCCVTFLLVCCSSLNNQKLIDERLQVLYDMYFNNFLFEKDFKCENDLVEDIEKQFLLSKTADK